MKPQFYLAVTLLIAGSASIFSCSDDDYVNEPVNDNEIRFTAATDFNSRSGDITTSNLTEFNVYAYTGDNSTIFMENVKVTKNASNLWTYSPLKYWPAEKVNFYAFSPESWVGNSSPLSPIHYSDQEITKDIVYAVAAGQSGGSANTNAQVMFNFRHALAKVTLQLSSTNPDLKVNVTNVALSHIESEADFSFPTESTSGTPTQSTTGKWSNITTPVAYLYHMSSSQSDIVTLTDTPNDLSGNGLGGPKYLIPQPLVWEAEGKGEDNYISIMCSIYDAKTGVKLWPNGNTPAENIVQESTNKDGLLKFPLSTSQITAWQPGYSYIYNIVINSNSDMGTIEFGTPTVDTFVEVETTYE